MQLRNLHGHAVEIGGSPDDPVAVTPRNIGSACMDRSAGRAETIDNIPVSITSAKKSMDTYLQSKRPKTLAIALLATGIALSDSTRAAEPPPAPSPTDLVNQWAQLVVYAVTPYCQVLSNGLRVCQPIGLVGPAPDSPAAAYQPLVRVPLAPPSVQPPGMPPYAYPLPGVNPFLPAPAMPNTPWQPAPGTAPQWAAAPAAAAPASAELPSIVQPAVPAATPATATPAPASVTPAPAPPEPIQTAPAAETLAASPDTTAAADTVTAAPAAPALNEAAPPAPVEAAPALATAAVAIAHFDFDRAELTEAARAALDAWLARNAKGTRVVVTGHADRLGPAPYNLDLSRRRAEAVRDYLVRKGMDPRLITLVAMGETQPVIHCSGRLSPATIACLAPNRRVVIEP